MNLFLDNTVLLESLRGVIEDQHNELMAKLRALDDVLSSVATNVAAFRPLALATQRESHLSAQAVSILHQFNTARASKLYEHGLPGFSFWASNPAEWRSLHVTEPRFLDADLATLCELKLLRRSTERKGAVYTITRAGATIGNGAGISDRLT